MQTRVRATYENGVFIPVLNGEAINLPEQTEVEITIETLSADKLHQNTLAEELHDIAESMKKNTFSGNPPRLTREELHERR